MINKSVLTPGFSVGKIPSFIGQFPNLTLPHRVPHTIVVTAVGLPAPTLEGNTPCTHTVHTYTHSTHTQYTHSTHNTHMHAVHT